MASPLSFYRSLVGKKAVMAVTGIALFGFVLGHMVGNLKLYQGPETLNAYAEFLREMGTPLLARGELLWIVRLALLAAVGFHLHAAWVVTRASWAARPDGYRHRGAVQLGYAERTMRWGGVILALFVLYHLAHLTWGLAWAHPDFAPGDVYHNVVAGFRVWYVALFYMAAQVALGFHLRHGLWALFQSLGWSHPAWDRWRHGFATTFAWVITLGNLSFPLAVLTGVVR